MTNYYTNQLAFALATSIAEQGDLPAELQSYQDAGDARANLEQQGVAFDEVFGCRPACREDCPPESMDWVVVRRQEFDDFAEEILAYCTTASAAERLVSSYLQNASSSVDDGRPVSVLFAEKPRHTLGNTLDPLEGIEDLGVINSQDDAVELLYLRARARIAQTDIIRWLDEADANIKRSVLDYVTQESQSSSVCMAYRITPVDDLL